MQNPFQQFFGYVSVFHIVKRLYNAKSRPLHRAALNYSEQLDFNVPVLQPGQRVLKCGLHSMSNR